MKLHIVFFAAALGLAANAFGATPAPAAGTGMGPAGHHDFCKQNAQECTDLATKFDQWCSANADKCVKLKAFVEKRREWCEKNDENKGKCEAMMHRMHKHPKGNQTQGGNQGDSGNDDASTPPLN